MTAQNKTTIKALFETGDKPSQSDFGDLIDSYQNISESLTAVQSAMSTGSGVLNVTNASAATLSPAGTVGLQLLSCVTSASAANIIGNFNNPTLTGSVTIIGSAQINGVLNDSLGTQVSAGTSINLNTVTGNTVELTANNSVNTVVLSPGFRRTVRVSGTPTLVHSVPAFDLPTKANIVCASGDFFEVVGINGGVAVYNYQRANGRALAALGGYWAKTRVTNVSSGTLANPNNIASVSRVSVGQFTVTMSSAAANSDYVPLISCRKDTAPTTFGSQVVISSTTIFSFQTYDAAGALTDPQEIFIAVFA